MGCSYKRTYVGGGNDDYVMQVAGRESPVRGERMDAFSHASSIRLSRLRDILLCYTTSLHRATTASRHIYCTEYRIIARANCTMALKRKRSSPAFSSPGSDGSDVTMQSSPLSSFYHQSKPVDAILTKPTWSWPTYEDSPSHLNSRTRKRHRARPDEEQLCGMSGSFPPRSRVSRVC